MIAADPHPLLRFSAFETEFPAALEALTVPDGWPDRLRIGAKAPLERSEDVRKGVRDLLRHGGYKPTGRGKPSSEYLVRTAERGELRPINPAVDACNAVSLHSGLPISVVDAERLEPPLRVAVAEAGTRYVFNPSGQEIDLSGLLCLFDAAGPCANAVKDSQRTKTSPATRRTLSVVWASTGLEERLERAVAWYRGILAEIGATTRQVPRQDS